MATIYEEASQKLGAIFSHIEAEAISGSVAPSSPVAADLDVLFESNTQSYREVLLGTSLVHLINPSLDTRKPYASMGEGSYNGRTMDQSVVNPFLQAHRIPSSKGPYLAVFRRQVVLTKATMEGLRDKVGYASMLRVLDYLDNSSAEETENLIVDLLWRFITLRESSNISISKLTRISLEQIKALITTLLHQKSGGRFPLMVTRAAFETINQHFHCEWTINVQGINEADAATGAGGDVTILREDKIILAIEVTERPVDKARVVSTFNTKIATSGIQDYLYLLTSGIPATDALLQAAQYFAQGHEVNFAMIETWLASMLAAIGSSGRQAFNEILTSYFEDAALPKALKLKWNSIISELLSR